MVSKCKLPIKWTTQNHLLWLPHYFKNDLPYSKTIQLLSDTILSFVHLWNNIYISKFVSPSGKELKSLLVERLVQLENRLTQSLYRDGPVPSLQQVTTQIYLSIPYNSNLVTVESLKFVGGQLLWGVIFKELVGALFPDLPQCIINRLYIVFNDLLGMSFCD